MLIETYGRQGACGTEIDARVCVDACEGRAEILGVHHCGPNGFRQDVGALSIQHVSMSELAAEIARGFDRPVVDATGLNGRYDIRIDMAAVAAVNQADRIGAASAMMTALQEQMGLKLEGHKGRVDVLVIDHAEKTPTEN